MPLARNVKVGQRLRTLGRRIGAQIIISQRALGSEQVRLLATRRQPQAVIIEGKAKFQKRIARKSMLLFYRCYREIVAITRAGRGGASAENP